MPFEAAKCPTCGATIQVQSDADSAFCSSCGNRLETKKAIAEYKLELEINKPVPVKGLSSVENDLLRGNQCLEAKDWGKAYQVFGSAIDKQADCYEAWYGCLRAMTENFSWLNNSIANIDGEKGLSAVVRNSLRYSNAHQNEETANKLERLYNSLVDEYTNALSKISSKKTTHIICIFFSIVSFLGIIFSLIYNIEIAGYLSGIGTISFIFLVVFIIIGFKNGESYRCLEITYSNNFRDRLNTIKSAIKHTKSINS